MSIRGIFNWNAVRIRGMALLIEHAPCCMLSVIAGLVGISILNHNPVLELFFAIGGAIIGERIGHKYFSQKNNHSNDKGIIGVAKRYGVGLTFALATWGLHQVYFHDHDDHGHNELNHIEQRLRACNGPNQYLLDFPKGGDQDHSDHHGSNNNNHDHRHTPVCAFR